MKKLLKNRSQKAGLPPGSLVHIGETRLEGGRSEVTFYNQEKLRIEHPDLEQYCLVPDAHGVTWVNIDGVAQLHLLQKIGDCFNIHPLVLEDIANTDQRPKAEEYENYLFVVIKLLISGPVGIKSEQISLILGENWLITLQEGLSGDSCAPLRERLNNAKGKLRSRGADFLAYTLMDLIIDNYFVILEKLADEIELLEEELMKNPTPRTLAGIYRLKRELLFTHRSIWPLREVVSSLSRRDSTLIKESTIIYLRDLHDHTIHVVETVEALREMLSGMLDIYLSSVSNRMNGIMKVLTIIATIFMPLTFVVGLYGMNFKYMPELEWRWGYPVVLLILVLITLGMLNFFRKKKWF